MRTREQGVRAHVLEAAALHVSTGVQLQRALSIYSHENNLAKVRPSCVDATGDFLPRELSRLLRGSTEGAHSRPVA